MNHLNQDSKAILLLCSDLGLTQEMKKSYKPYTLAQWNKLAENIRNSTLEKPSELLVRDIEYLKSKLRLTDEELNRIRILLKRGGNIAIEIEGLASKGIYITTRAEENYPLKLKKVLRKNSPPVIYYSGNLQLVNKSGVAIVGSRDVDDDGKLFAEKLSRRCVQEDLIIVSGGARGVDSIAENNAIAEGGSAISFVPDSLTRKIKDKDIRNTILDGKLLMITINNPSARFYAYAAMDRNKYIYALSEYAVVVSSKEKNGGTWAGADENLKKKYVPLFVRSGDEVPLGNKKLIELGGNPLGLEIIENSNISIRQWFEDNKKAEFIQDSLYQNGSNILSAPQEDRIAAKVEENINGKGHYKTSPEMHEQTESLDAYNIIVPYIKKVLSEPKNQEELSEVFKVNKAQMSQWLKRAIENNEIVKLKRPVKYALKKNSKKLSN